MNEVSKELEKLTVFTGKFAACEDYLKQSDPLACYFIVASTKTEESDECSVIKMYGRQKLFFQFLARVTDVDLPYVVLKVQI